MTMSETGNSILELHAGPAPDDALLTIIVPVYNEESLLGVLCDRLAHAADSLRVRAVEILIISDGSTDRSNELIRARVLADSRFEGILLARNFGHQAAVSVGLEHARGDFVVIIDGDLQDPPEVIERLLATVAGDADVAFAVREKRKEGTFWRFLYASYYRILQRVADIEIPVDTGDFCCMRRCVVDAMLLLPERNRFVRGLRAWVGFRQVGVPYVRDARFSGVPRYTLKKLLRLAGDGLFGFSALPISVMQILGFVISGVSLLVAAFYFGWFILDPGKFPAGFATLIISLWFLAGMQLLFLGFIGEYVIRTFDESRRRPGAIISMHLRQAQPTTTLAVTKESCNER
jgi:dolichol-phosphate mannosyltransferase